MALAPLIVPDLIRNDNVSETDITEDCAILYFTFGEKLPMGIVMDEGRAVTICDAPEILEQAREADRTAHAKGYVLTDAIKAGELLSLFMEVM